MASVLVKPGLIKGRMIHKTASTTASFIGTTGTHYFIKLMDSAYDFYSPVENVTGDGDQQPKFENNMLLYGDVVLSGAMIARQAIGLYQLITETLDSGSTTSGVSVDNPIGDGSAVLHTFSLGGDSRTAAAGGKERFQFKMILERMRVRAQREGRFVAVRIFGKMTDMTDTEMADIENVVT